MLTQRDLRQLAASAATTYERLRGVVQPRPGGAGQTGQRLVEWCRFSAHADYELFAKQLDAVGHTYESAQSLLGSVTYAESAVLPSWVDEFAWVVDSLCCENRPVSEAENRIAFAPIFCGLIDSAERRALGDVEDFEILAQSARSDLRLLLYRELASLCGSSLLTRFAAFRAAEAVYGQAGGIGSKDVVDAYHRFLQDMRAGAFRDYFLEYPVLARLTTTVTCNWINNVGQFLNRLKQDQHDLRRLCEWATELPCVTAITGDLSDRHLGGKTTWRIDFASGPPVLYKPKDLATEAHWASLIEYLARAEAPPSARPQKIITRQGYGWSEHINYSECRSPADASEFFQRAGATLCLLRILGATDIHFENVIAAGQMPAVVDLETVMQPALRDPDANCDARRSYAVARDYLRNSVLATGFLPSFLFGAGGEPIPIGALSIVNRSTRTVWSWQNPNTDSMRLVLSRIPDAPQNSLPTVDGRLVAPQEFASEICRGFAEMYKFAHSNRFHLLGAGGPVAVFRDSAVRVVLRPTEMYSRLLRRGNHHAHYQDGVRWSVGLDMRSTLHDSYASELAQRVQRAEVDALSVRDIPYFGSTANSRDLLFADGDRVEDLFERSGFDRATSTITEMSLGNLRKELRLIRCTLARSVSTDRTSRARKHRRSDTKLAASDPFLSEATRIGELLKRQAITAGAGAAWIGLTPLPRSHASHFDVTGYDLYSGAAGIALFLGTLGKAANREDFTKLAAKALIPVRSELADDHSRERLVAQIGIGGAAGASSILYCFTLLGEIVDDSSLRHDADALATLIGETQSGESPELDVVSGVAGSLLTLLRSHAVTKGPEMLQWAKNLGDTLISKQDEQSGAWLTIGPVPLCGFSHGAAGICLALLRLYLSTAEEKYLAAAEAGWLYERRCFRPNEKNWPDYRDPGATGAANGWCHGACGIGLARLAGLEHRVDHAAHLELIVAVESVQAANAAPDHLCCGEFGLIELLASSAAFLNDGSLLRLAHSRAAARLTRARQLGSYCWPAGGDEDNPGFFTGLAGVGYTLLRLRSPSQLPRILTWN